MNRAPSKNDIWWSQHQAKCTGTFEKVSEPEKKPKPESKPKSVKSEKMEKSVLTSSHLVNNNSKLDNFFLKPISSQNSQPKSMPTSKLSQPPPTPPQPQPPTSTRPIKKETNLKTLETFFSAQKRKISSDGSSSPEIVCLDDDDDDDDCKKFNLATKSKLVKTERTRTDEIVVISESDKVECPVCFERVDADLISLHVESHF